MPIRLIFLIFLLAAAFNLSAQKVSDEQLLKRNISRLFHFSEAAKQKHIDETLLIVFEVTDEKIASFSIWQKDSSLVYDSLKAVLNSIKGLSLSSTSRKIIIPVNFIYEINEVHGSTEFDVASMQIGKKYQLFSPLNIIAYTKIK